MAEVIKKLCVVTDIAFPFIEFVIGIHITALCNISNRCLKGILCCGQLVLHHGFYNRATGGPQPHNRKSKHQYQRKCCHKHQTQRKL